jgi:hypothetical protein
MELTLERLRQMGGQAVLKKYGTKHFSKLGKISAMKRKAKKKIAQPRAKLVLDK